MKTKDEILNYAMDLWVQEVVKNNLVQADVLKSVCPVCKCIAGSTCAHSWHYDNKGNWR